VVLTGSIDAFFDFSPGAAFCVIENWTQPGEGIGNTSVYRFRVGSHPEILAAMTRDPDGALRRYANEQTMASRMIPGQVFWPHPWCVSFKHDLLPPFPLNFFRPPELCAEARVVCFTGHPNPDEARDGIWPAPWPKRFYKHVRPTPWIAEHWR
jgi:hypothetical protein